MTVKPAVGAVVAVLLLVAGAVLWWHGRPVGFGWFAYGPAHAPGVATVFGGPSLLTTEQLVGVVLAAVGALLLAGVVGYRLGRRHQP